VNVGCRAMPGDCTEAADWRGWVALPRHQGSVSAILAAVHYKELIR